MRWRERAALAAATCVLAAGGVLLADEHAAATTTPVAAIGTEDLRGYVTATLDAELEVVQRARATVDVKLLDSGEQRARRTRAAYKLLRAGSAPAWVQPDERMATARRRAAARWLLGRDQREQALLADEAAALARAEAQIAADRLAAATVALPPGELDRPVRGSIVRHFGTLVHERSKATLSRRGLDFEVDDGAEVVSVADGVIAYAGPIRGLDHGLVIHHGTFLTVIGKLDPPAIASGDHVVRGQVLGTPARRRVYLEVRVLVGPGGLPVDPEPLLASERRD